jgi:hypothetical protein
MKRSGSAVTFADAPLSRTTGADAARPKLRYGRLLAGIAGGSAQPSAPPAAHDGDSAAARRTFNPAAAPAKGALKVAGASSSQPSAPPLYPHVTSSSSSSSSSMAGGQPALHHDTPNPATGLTGGYKTPGGAALASALGVHSDAAIPPPSPPSLPTVPSAVPQGAGGGAPVGVVGLEAAAAAAAAAAAISNPLAVPQLPHMAHPVAVVGSDDGGAAPMLGRGAASPPCPCSPPPSPADGTVQLTTPGYAAGGPHSKLQAGQSPLLLRDVGVALGGGGKMGQRDQGSAGDGVACEVLPSVDSKDVEAAFGGGPPDSPRGQHHTQQQHYADDDASRCARGRWAVLCAAMQGAAMHLIARMHRMATPPLTTNATPIHHYDTVA